MRNKISLFAAFIGLLAIVAFLAPAQAQTASLQVSENTWKTELADHFKQTSDDISKLVFGSQGMAWDSKCWNRDLKQWSDTAECSTGTGKIVFDAQNALILCRAGQAHFDGTVFGTPLKWLSEEGRKGVQDGVDYCKASAEAALAVINK